MKKLYRKGQVHPSPSPSPSPQPSSDQFSLSYLPAAILTLAATLSPQDKEVLAYLLSCSSSSSSSSTPFDFDPSKSSVKKQSNFNTNNLQQHPPDFGCYCFTCYTSYWARWDSSSNRQLIHEIIDAFEDNLVSQRKNKKKQGITRREKRKNSNKKSSLDINTNTNVNHLGFGKINVNDDDNNHGFDGSGRVGPELGRVDSVEEQGGEEEDDDDEKMLCSDEMKQGSVRKIVSFIGERIWGSVWG